MSSTCYFLVDGNNFFASCERLFRPDLIHTPIVVLSNNDGCVVARSQEAKALGIKMAVPFYQIQSLIKRHNIVAFSSNYALYGDISQRMMNVMSNIIPDIEVYSIDEAFLTAKCSPQKAEALAITIKQAIKQQVGIDVGIGIAPTKTLAKLANHAAKQFPKTEGIVNLMARSRQERLMKITDIAQLWGIGRHLSIALKRSGIHTAWDLAQSNKKTVRQRFSVVLEKIIVELNGVPCYGLETEHPDKQQIIHSRSFSQPITHYQDMATAVSVYAEKIAEKLRKEGLITQNVGVFLSSNRFKDYYYSDQAAINLPVPTNDTRMIISKALIVLPSIWKDGVSYTKMGLCLRELNRSHLLQQDIFNEAQEAKSIQLMATIDQLNQKYGDIIALPAGKQSNYWQMKRERLSPSYTTKWREIPLVF